MVLHIHRYSTPDGSLLKGNPTSGFNLGKIKLADAGNYTFSADDFLGLPDEGVNVIYVDSEETSGEDGKKSNAVDGNPNTFWHTSWEVSNDPQPHEIHLYLGVTSVVKGLTYLLRQDSDINGTVVGYQIFVSNNKTAWGTAVAAVTWANTKTLKTVSFTEKQGRYVRFRSTSEVSGNPRQVRQSCRL